MPMGRIIQQEVALEVAGEEEQGQEASSVIVNHQVVLAGLE